LPLRRTARGLRRARNTAERIVFAPLAALRRVA